MSFICEGCHAPTPNGMKPYRKITQTRTRTYDNGGTGWEIVHEGLFCSFCEQDMKEGAETETVDMK